MPKAAKTLKVTSAKSKQGSEAGESAHCRKYKAAQAKLIDQIKTYFAQIRQTKMEKTAIATELFKFVEAKLHQISKYAQQAASGKVKKDMVMEPYSWHRERLLSQQAN